MINHGRTLLLNRDGVGFHGHVGEEYTPETFYAVTLPSYLHNVRRVIFGQQPDALMYNYRAYELMRMLHSTELKDYVLALDPRITYHFDNTSEPFGEVFPFQRESQGSTVVNRLADGNNTAAISARSANDPSSQFVGDWTSTTEVSEDLYYNKYQAISTPTTVDGNYWEHRITAIPWGVYKVYFRWKKSTGFGDPAQQMQLWDKYNNQALSGYYYFDVENKTPADYEHITLPGRIDPTKSFDFAYMDNVAIKSGTGAAAGQVSLQMIHTGAWQNFNYFDAWCLERLQPEPGLSIVGDFSAPDILGRCYQQWNIAQQVDGDIEATHETRPRKFDVYDVTYESELSPQLLLPESPLSFQAYYDPGAAWRVESYARPQRGLGDLEAAIGKLGEETMLELFHVGDPEGEQEPWLTFRNLWRDHTETPYRLGAVVLAMIYHTHDIWNVG